MSARKGWTQLSKDQHLLVLVVAIDDFLQRFFFFWQSSGLYSHFHTWILIYVPLSQTMSNDNNENHDKRIEECRRKLLKCSFLASRFSVSVTQRPLKCTLWSLWPAGGGIEYLVEESITCWRQSLNLCPIPNRSVFLNNLATALWTPLWAAGRDRVSITCWRQALSLRPHGDPNCSDFLNNLATALSTRFEHLGRMDDLEEAITRHRQVLALRPHGHL